MLMRIAAFVRKDWKRFLITLLICAVLYTALTYLGALMNPNKPQTKTAWQLLSEALHVILESAVVYYLIIHHIAVPLLRTKRLVRFFIALVTLFTLKFGFDYLIDFPPPPDSLEGGLIAGSVFITFLVQHLFINMFTLCISFAVALLREWNEKSKRQEELEKQMTAAELSAIKYQINPHFLFNSLNFIYSKTVPLSEEVSNAVLLLSEIMRYALGKEEDANGKVALSRELAHMKNVIAINQMRFNHKLNIQYNEQIDNPQAKITPLVLITLVENAFKHGDLSDAANPLILQVDVNSKRLHVYICNKKKKGPKELSTGIGLNNVQQRLQLMYGKAHQFLIKDDGPFYITDLTINL
jgi:two-component system LytT family sensor kinase